MSREYCIEHWGLRIEHWGLRKVDDRRAACAVSLNDNGWTRHIVGRLNPVKYHITPPIDTGSSYCVCSAIRKPTQPFWGLANMIGNHVLSEYISYLLSRQRGLHCWCPHLLTLNQFDLCVTSDFNLVFVFIPNMLNNNLLIRLNILHLSNY